MILSIVIVNWNAFETLNNCLASIRSNHFQLEGLSFETILVDNASSDNSFDWVAQNYPQIHQIRNCENLGYARANNQAASIAAGDYLLFLNPDAFLHESSLNILFKFIQTNPKVGAVGPKVLNPDGSLQLSAHPFPTLFSEIWRLFHLDAVHPVSRYSKDFYSSKEPQKVDSLSGACFLLRRNAVSGKNIFDEDFFMFSEEVDLFNRIKSEGWLTFWLPSAVVTHIGGQSTSQASDRMFVELYRSKVRYFQKHYNNFYAQLYKMILYVISLTRIIPAIIFQFFSPKSKNNRLQKNLRYRLLIREIHSM